GQSGSTGWDASVRSRLYLAAPKGEADALLDPDLRELARKKSNYAGRDDLIGLRWVDGVFIATQQRPAALFAAAGRQRAERIFLELLDKLTAEGQRVSHNDRASNYAPKLFARRPEADGLRKTDFETSMHALFSSGRIV